MTVLPMFLAGICLFVLGVWYWVNRSARITLTGVAAEFEKREKAEAERHRLEVLHTRSVNENQFMRPDFIVLRAQSKGQFVN